MHPILSQPIGHGHAQTGLCNCVQCVKARDKDGAIWTEAHQDGRDRQVRGAGSSDKEGTDPATNLAAPDAAAEYATGPPSELEPAQGGAIWKAATK